MDTNLLAKVETQYLKQSLPKIEVGDTVSVTSAIRDISGKKIRSQVFRGIVLAIKGTGLSRTVTVRKITSGVGVEKIFPIHAPVVEKIEIEKKGRVRRSKIYYMRDRIGKKAMKVDDSTKEIEVVEYKEAEEPVEEKLADTQEVKEEVSQDQDTKEEVVKVEEKAEESK